MDFSSPYVLYVVGSFILAGGVLTILLLRTLQADRKAQSDLKKWNSDETKT
jgi:hypothetical protein